MTTDAQDVQPLWAAYHASRCNSDRDRLVDHYLPWAQQVATRIAKQLHIRDVDNAVAEACAALAARIIPGHKRGRRSFHRFATVCIRRVIVDCWRAEAATPGGSGLGCYKDGDEDLLSDLPTPCRPSAVCWVEATSDLPPIAQAAAFLRYAHGRTIPEIQGALSLSRQGVHRVLRQIQAQLKATLGLTDQS